jgi:GH24 family phage-related lysozyme (muramidase)
VTDKASRDAQAPRGCTSTIFTGVVPGFGLLAQGEMWTQKAGMGLSDDEVDYLLQNDIERVIKELSTEYRWFNSLDDVRKDAMIDISFNLGATRLRGFRRALAAMEVADYKMAAKEFLDSKWSRDVKGRATELCYMIEMGSYL